MKSKLLLAGMLVSIGSTLIGISSASAALITSSTNANTIANAMSSQSGLITAASWTTGPSGSKAAGTAGVIGNFMPTDGADVAVLTTGDVGLADPPNNQSGAGVSNGTSARNVRDLTILKVDVNVPTGASCIGVDLVFYSEEYQEFVGSQYNDAFLAELDGNTWSYNSANNAVTAPKNFAYDTNGKQLTVNTSLGRNSDTGLQYDGSTDLLRARTQISAGAHSLYFTIYDAGDNIYDSAVFLDNLRAANVPAEKCKSGAALADTDGDGLADDWEENGYDANEDGTVEVDLPAMGARKDHKDVFIECDYMQGHQLNDGAITTIESSFKNAPVSNPDNTTGINMHFDNGANSVMNPQTGETWGTKSDSDQVTHQDVLGSYVDGNGDGDTSDNSDYYDWSAFDTVKNANFSSARLPIFHYCLSAHQYGSGSEYSTGLSRDIGGSDFIAALGRTSGGVDYTLNNAFQTAAPMHEFGHNLGLYHAGSSEGEAFNWKPNQMSVMNYLYFTGIPQKGTNALAYDYSRYPDAGGANAVSSLDETSLSESAGLSATGNSANLQMMFYCAGDDPNTVNPQGPFNMGTAVSWNCDADKTDSGAFDVNLSGAGDQTLVSREEWSTVKFRGGSSAVGGAGRSSLVPKTTAANVDVHPSSKVFQRILAVALNDRQKPRLELKRIGKRLQLVASDNRGVDRVVIKSGKKVKTVLAKKSGKSSKVLRKKVKIKNVARAKAIAIDVAGNISRPVRPKRKH